MSKFLPQNEDKSELGESQRRKDFNYYIEVLMKQGFSKETALIKLKQKIPNIQIPTNLDQSISDTNSPNTSHINLNSEEILTNNSEDEYKYLTTDAVAFSQKDYAYVNSFKKSSSLDEVDKKPLNKIDDVGQSSVCTKEPNSKKVRKPRKRNLLKQTESSEVKLNSSRADTSAIFATPMKTKKQKAKGHKVGILSENYPDELLNNEQLIQVQEAIMENVKKQADEVIKPRFLNSNLKIGWLLVTCADSDTVEWLLKLCLKPWIDANLIIREEKNIPRATKVFMGSFPKTSESNDEILKFLKAQNAGLSNLDWKVHNRRETGNKTIISFSVEHGSMQQIENNDYKLSYRFGEITLKPGNSTNSTKLEEQLVNIQGQLD